MRSVVRHWLGRVVARAIASTALGLFLCLPSMAADVLVAAPIPGGLEGELLTPYLQQVIVQDADSQDPKLLAEAIAGGAWYRRDGKLAPDFSYESQWFVFSVLNESAERTRHLYAELAAPDIQGLEWFVYAQGELQAYYELGSNKPFSARPVPYSRLLMPIEVPAAEMATVVMRVKGHSRLLVERTLLWDQQARLDKMMPELAVSWFFIGVLAVMVLYHFFIALITRELTYWYYIAWLSVALLMLFSHQGLGFWFLWPEWPWWEQRATLTLSLVMLGFFGLFSAQFLNLNMRQPLVNRIVLWNAICLLLLAALYVVFLESVLFWVVRLGVSLILSLVVIVWLASFRQWLAGYKEGLHFFIAWLPFMAYASYEVARRVWNQTWYDPVSPLMQWAFALTITLLAIALADRMRELRDRSQKARVENRAKSEFLAKMSHEIRTPLNGMLGMASLLRETRMDKTQRHYSDVIFSSGTALLTVINDILDYSKIEAGKMTLESIDFNLERLALDTTAIFKVQADEKGLDLIFDMDPACPRWVTGDPNRLRQILINMLGNAIKFTEKGEVMIRLLPDVSAPDLVRLEVCDTGIGIEKEKSAHLFDFFTQVDSSTSRRYGGTGLGLAICKELTALMGGSVGVDSRLHEGSTFWAVMRLPAAKAQTEPSLPPDVVLKGKRLLVVDDCESFTALVQRYAREWGVQVVVAHSGVKAEQEAMDALANNRPFDLMSIDLHMPGMDGLELARRLSQNERLAKTPKLLLTSTIDLPSRADLRANGLSLVVEKPVSPWMLWEAYARLLGSSVHDPKHMALEASTVKASAAKSHILVAEDNDVNQMVIRGMLERLGHEVTVVKNGALVVEAYMTCMKPGAHWRPVGMILMDCEMPELDGYEATERIRQWELKQDLPPIPIVALTAHVLPEYLQRCLESGMNDYLLKPVNVESLQAKMNTYLAQSAMSRQ
ncbi:MAG TPA: response regulator [Pseudomonadales bacterium]